MNNKETSARAKMREKVIIEAWSAFTANGIKTIRMDDIANALKMSKRTLYELFEDKETLLKECFLYNQKKNKEQLRIIINESRNVLEVILKCYKGSIELYHNINEAFFDDMKKYPRIKQIIHENRDHENRLTIKFLKQGVEQGIFRQDTNFEIIHMLLRKQIELLVTSEITSMYSFLDIYEAIMFTYLRGISTPKGLEELEDFIQEHRKELNPIQHQ